MSFLWDFFMVARRPVCFRETFGCLREIFSRRSRLTSWACFFARMAVSWEWFHKNDINKCIVARIRQQVPFMSDVSKCLFARITIIFAKSLSSFGKNLFFAELAFLRETCFPKDVNMFFVKSAFLHEHVFVGCENLFFLWNLPFFLRNIPFVARTLSSLDL